MLVIRDTFLRSTENPRKELMYGNEEKENKITCEICQAAAKEKSGFGRKVSEATESSPEKDNMRRLRNFFIILAVLVLALFIGGNVMLKKATGQTLFGCMKEAKELVDESTPETFRLAQTSYIYSDDGTQLAALSEDVDATYLEYDQIPADVVNAFVAVEDRTFWKNSGVDFKGIVRVCLNYVKSRGQVAEGASTITQQLARGTFLSNEKTLSRKIKEIFIAWELKQKNTVKSRLWSFTATAVVLQMVFTAWKMRLRNILDGLSMICPCPRQHICVRFQTDRNTIIH